MQNQQTQQNPQNGTQSFFPMEQGPNNFDPYQIGIGNKNTATRQGSEISSQIGGAAIGASQTETPITGAQEPLDVQTPPNAIDVATQKSALNPEISGMNTESANRIIPFPSPESQAQKKGQKAEDQATTDGVHKIVPLNDALDRKDLPVIEKIAKEVEDNPAEAYGRIVDLRTYFSNKIRRIG